LKFLELDREKEKKLKKPNKKKGQKWEQKCQRTINSGQLYFSKGDLQTKNYVIECKYTEKKGYRISTKMIKKIWDEALDANKLPAIVIGIKDENCVWKLKVSIEKEVR